MFTLAGFVVLVAGASVLVSAGASVDAAVDSSGAEAASELELDPQATSASKAIGTRRDFFDTIFFDIENDTS
jgi:ascorbate-specific PTS system EIIC-type component UlaA